MTRKVPNFPTDSWLFHIAFWLIYWVFSSLQDYFFHSHFQENFNLPIVLGSVGLVYFNYYYWIQKYLIQKKSYWFYSVSTVILIILNALTINFFVYTFLIPDPYYLSLQSVFIMSVDTSVIVGFTTAFKFMQQWYERNHYAKELEKKNLESELEMLKSQINPHFIFNTLNTIYFLMEQKDEKAKEVLLRFSDILSHQLYDYNKNEVMLNKEIEYLKNYIELQRLRHDEDLLTLKCDLLTHGNGCKIAPMLLIPFVENAFKHGANAQGYEVEILLEMTGRQLHFRTFNSVNPNRIIHHKLGGIGLKNVQRRLDLSYPNQHQLKIEKKEISFLVDLTIEL